MTANFGRVENDKAGLVLLVCAVPDTWEGVGCDVLYVFQTPAHLSSPRNGPNSPIPAQLSSPSAHSLRPPRCSPPWPSQVLLAPSPLPLPSSDLSRHAAANPSAAGQRRRELAAEPASARLRLGSQTCGRTQRPARLRGHDDRRRGAEAEPGKGAGAAQHRTRRT